MKKTIVGLGVAILLISSLSTIVFAASPSSSPPVSDFSSQQILVKFKPGTSLPEAAQIHRQLGGQVKETIAGIGVQVITVPKGQAMAKAKAYGLNARVAYAEPDFVAQAIGSPDDPYFGLQWGLTKVEAAQAWEMTNGSNSINIAIVDTGVDMDHPDLVDKLVSNINLTNFGNPDDVYGHGTHVAGIAAATTNNGAGVAGLGYEATIMNVKVLDDNGMGAYSWIVSGIIWATDHGAEVINMSLGGSYASSALEDAVNYAWNKGVVLVAAAGNNGDTVPMYPAYYTNCIAVAATDANDARASWSNYGDWIDVAAPGVSIYSTLKNGNYGYLSGTSMASPHVAGLAALVLTTVSDANGDGKLNDEVRSQIEATCDDIGINGIGYGRINAASAVGGEPVSPGAITGQVTDAEDGSPISSAEVSNGIRTALTDAAGIYTIDDILPGNYQVVARKEGYESSSLTVDVISGNNAIADFSLSQIIVPGSITGTVTDAENGSPIVDATVTDGTRTAATDATGKYIIADLPPGSYEVTVSKEGYESSSSTVDVPSGNSAVVDFSLNEVIVLGSITGSVTDAEDGSPIVGTAVTDGARTATTDASGEYTIADVPSGSYEVTASKEGYQTSSSTVDVLPGTTAVAEFSLNEIIIPGSITGSVTDAEDGSPIVGATVNDGTRTAITDASGKYTLIDVPPGSYEVTASKEGYESTTSSVTVTSGETSEMNFALNQKPPVTDGMWVDSIGFVRNGQNLFIEIEVVTPSGALSGANVDFSLECSNGEVWNFSDATNNAGLARCKVGKAPIGNYLTTVNSLICSGFTWDMSKGITSAGYALSD
jgi:thermitase